MKKIVALLIAVLTVAVSLMGTITVAAIEADADYVANHEKPSSAVPAEREFAPVGNVNIHWLGEQTENIDFDGELDEWDNLGISPVIIDANNLLVWHVNGNVVYDNPNVFDEGFSIQAYFAADENYLYVALSVDDERFALADNTYGYNGDAFQLGIDWNRRIEHAIEGGADYSNNKNIFYSFSCMEENGPLWVTVEEGFKHRAISEVISENPFRPDMKGSAGATDGGWGAELCLSWELLYGDYEYKTWESHIDPFDAENPLVLGMTLCYINRSSTRGVVEWAAGTFNHGTGYPQSLPTENGLYATLEWDVERSVNCSGIGGHLHNYGNWEVLQHATCTATGVRRRICSCGNIDVETIPQRGHAYGEWELVGELICTEDSTWMKTCPACGDIQTETREAEGHVFDDFNIVSEGSCTEDMVIEWICACGETQTETTTAVGHLYAPEEDGWQTVVESACVEKGIRMRTCLVCGDAEVEVIPATGHHYGEWVIVSEGTATQNGVKIRVCPCGEAERETIVTVTEPESTAEIDDTEVVVETTTAEEAVATVEQKPSAGGCGASVGGWSLMTALIVGAVTVVCKRKNAR